MFDLSNITPADLLNASALARVEDSIAKAKKVFAGCAYWETVARVLEDKRRQASLRPPGVMSIYCSALCEAIDLICKIGLQAVDCQKVFERLDVAESAGEILEMIPRLEVFSRACQLSVRHNMRLVLPEALSLQA